MARGSLYDGKNWDNTVGLVEIINAVALAVLYGVDDTTWNTVSKAACQYGQKDWLVGFLLSSRDGEPNYLTWKVRMKILIKHYETSLKPAPKKLRTSKRIWRNNGIKDIVMLHGMILISPTK